MLLECINTSVWNLFIIPEEDWSQSKSIEEYEVNKLKNEDGYSCFHAFVQLPGHSSKTVSLGNSYGSWCLHAATYMSLSITTLIMVLMKGIFLLILISLNCTCETCYLFICFH